MIPARRVIVALALLTLGATAAPAAATQRFVAPDGKATGNCTNTMGNPACELKYAVENQTTTGDEVIVAPGNYSVSSLTVNKGLTVHGVAGQARPVITVSNSNSVSAAGGTRLRHLEVHSDATALYLSDTGAVGEDLVVKATGSTSGSTGGGAALLGPGTLLRDSVAYSQAQGAAAVFAAVGASDVRNVTAIATGSNSVGVRAAVLQNLGDPLGPPCYTPGVLTAKNVIARGTAADVSAEPCAGDSSKKGALSISYSNFRADKTVRTGTFTDQGHNQTTVDPLFANAATGDFHQLPTSPTIDAGTSDSLLGAVDIDGDARTLGPAPDIGADEATVTDRDNDGANEPGDNCPGQANPGQADVDGDGIGDACDPRDDRPVTTPAQPGPTSPQDLAAPLVTGVKVDKRWAIRPTVTPLTAAAKAKKGTTFRYTLSEPSTVTIAIARAQAGRKVGRRCVAPKRSNRKKRRCTRYVTAVTLTRTATAGPNSTAFSGRWVDSRNRARSLKPGSYRATVTATDGAGNKSAAKQLSFKVVRK